MPDIRDRPVEEVVAGDDFRDTLVKYADVSQGEVPFWRGWALMEAFLAGIDYARSCPPTVE
jgi:hypothetical protein